MSLPRSTRRLVLASKPTGKVNLSTTFKLETKDLALPLQPNQVLLKTLYISNDPAQRTWIQAGADPARSYTPPVNEGETMRAMNLSSILDSTCSEPWLAKGKLITTTSGWAEYAVMNASTCQPVPELPGLDPTHFLGAFAITGATALYGLEVVRTSSKDKVAVVSGAAGATGSMAVQIAKRILGVEKVIGIAGTADKCRWVETDLGADLCVNYKDSDFEAKLAEATGRKADVYFDNVGGEITDFMLSCMARNGRIAACGGISRYDDSGDGAMKMKNWMQIVAMRLEIKGFIIFDVAARLMEMRETLVKAYQDGKIKVDDQSQTVVEADLEGVPEVWQRLYSGGNTGKLLTKLKL